jgi:hypothetical protein
MVFQERINFFSQMPKEPTFQIRESTGDSDKTELIVAFKICDMDGTEIAAMVGYNIAPLELADIIKG